jgi:hypothetical protein
MPFINGRHALMEGVAEAGGDRHDRAARLRPLMGFRSRSPI